MAPFPPKDGLEAFEGHVRIELGELRYLAEAREFVAPVGVGEGFTPVTGFHCVIERPDSVSRVAPPTSTITKIGAATANSQKRRHVAGRRVDPLGLQSRFLQNHSCPKGIIARAAHDNSFRAFRKDRMSPRFRRFLGGFVMIAFVLIYALVAMALTDSRPMHEAPAFVQTLLYVVLGLASVLPLMPLIRWMESGGRSA
jgi:hypothetical protein